MKAIPWQHPDIKLIYFHRKAFLKHLKIPECDHFFTFISGFNSCIARKRRIVSLRPHIFRFKTKLILKQVKPGSYVVRNFAPAEHNPQSRSRNFAPAPADGRGLAGCWRKITGTGAILHIWAIFDCRISIERMKTRIKQYIVKHA